ncbi:MAG: hypothetical protein HYU41_08555 [Candidatus Rokubacteria bacterium]|nr:hypothetical protein [Candidatus Rokubacteria bacterium]
MTDVQRLLDALTAARVDFVIVGGVALVLRGSSRVTIDLDVCYARDRDNLRRLAGALAPFHPRLRGAPSDLPFLWDERTLASGLNFTLTTDLGDVDILGEIPGIGDYAKVAAGSSDLSVGSTRVLVLDLDALERAKRAAGRAKDLLDLAEIAEIRRRSR